MDINIFFRLCRITYINEKDKNIKKFNLLYIVFIQPYSLFMFSICFSSDTTFAIHLFSFHQIYLSFLFTLFFLSIYHPFVSFFIYLSMHFLSNLFLIQSIGIYSISSSSRIFPKTLKFVRFCHSRIQFSSFIFCSLVCIS